MAFNHKNTSSKTINILQDCLRNSKLRKTRDIVSKTHTSFQNKAENSNSGESTNSSALARPNDLPTFPMNRIPTDTSHLPAYLHEAANNKEMCSTQYSFFATYYKWYLEMQIQTGQIKYEDRMKEIFMNSTFDYSSNQNHRKCLEEEKSYRTETERQIQIAKQLKEMALELTNSNEISEALSYANQLVTRYQDIRDITVEHAKMRENCYWYRDIFRGEFELTHGSIQQMYVNIPFIDQLNGQFIGIGNYYTSLSDVYKSSMIPTLLHLEEYLSRNITKNKLHGLLELNTFIMARENVLEFNQDLHRDLKYFIESVKNVLENFASSYSTIAQLEIPILTTYNVHELMVVKLAKDIDDKYLQDLVESLKHNLNPGLGNLLWETSKRIVKRLNGVKEEIIRPMEDLMEEIKEFSYSLQEYERSTIMDTGFFMYVHFAEKLSYELKMTILLGFVVC